MDEEREGEAEGEGEGVDERRKRPRMACDWAVANARENHVDERMCFASIGTIGFVVCRTAAAAAAAAGEAFTALEPASRRGRRARIGEMMCVVWTEEGGR